MVVGVFSGWAEVFSIWFNGVSFGWHLHQSVILVRFSVGLWVVSQLVVGLFFSLSLGRSSGLARQSWGDLKGLSKHRFFDEFHWAGVKA